MRAIEAALRDRRTPRARLLEAKDAVAQLNGSLEKVGNHRHLYYRFMRSRASQTSILS